MHPLMKKYLLSAVCFTTFSSVAMPQQPASLVSVESAKVEQVNPTMWLPGNVVSRRNAQISAEQTGRLLWIEDVGAVVEKGQLIATLDNRHLTLQQAKQRAQLKQFEAEVAFLAKQKKRLSALKQKNNASISELEKTTKDLQVAENEVLAKEIQLKEIELSIEKSAIRAPFAGHISQRFVHEGELISVGRALVQLTDTKHLDIQVAAPLTIAPFLQKDVKVLVKWQDKLMELPVRAWSQAGDITSRTFDVRLLADNLALISGTPVTVSLPKQQAKQSTLVPRDALVLRENETFVLAVDDENNAKKVNVLVGQGVGRWISVIGEVHQGDNVIVRGGERLRDGQKVRINEDYLAQNR